MRKRFIIVCIGLLAALPLAARGSGEDQSLFGGTTGSGNIREKKLDFSDFTSISVGYGMRLDIRKTSGYSVTVRTDDNILEKIIVEKNGSNLEFSLPSGTNLLNVRIEVSIGMPDLEAINGSGGSRINVVMGRVSRDFKLNLSGGARLDGNISANDFNLELSGGSTMEITGTGRNVTLNGSGGAVYRLADFQAENIDAELSGGSTADTTLTGELIVNGSGGARLTYRGDPASIAENLSGGARVSERK